MREQFVQAKQRQMMNLPIYRHVFLSDLEWMLLPPILAGKSFKTHRVGADGKRFTLQVQDVDGRTLTTNESRSLYFVSQRGRG